MKSLKSTLTGRRRTVAAVLTATVVLGGAGAATAVAFAEDGDHDDTQVATTTSPGTDHDDHDSTLTKTTKVDIKRGASNATKSVAGTVTAVELEGQQGKPVWKADVTDFKGTEHELTVNATDGKVTATGADKDNESDDRSGDAGLAKSAKTDLAKAVDAALAKVKGTATSADLENDHGKTTAWHVDVTDTKGHDHEVTVDAQSGKVTAAKTDDDRSDSNSSSGDHDDD